MINVDVFSEEKAWSKKLKKKELFFKKVCSFFPKKYQFSNKKVNFSLLLSNNKGTKKLNKDFRKESELMVIFDFKPFIDVILLISIFLLLHICKYEDLLGLCKLIIYEDNNILEFKNEILLVSKMKYILYLILGMVCIKE